MKPQTRYFTAAALLAIGSIAAALFPPHPPAPYAGRAAAFGTTRRTTASVPTADSSTTAANTRLCRASNATIRAGDTLDKAWFILGEPAQSHGNHWVWEAKGGGKTAEIRADGERVGTVRCGG